MNKNHIGKDDNKQHYYYIIDLLDLILQMLMKSHLVAVSFSLKSVFSRAASER